MKSFVCFCFLKKTENVKFPLQMETMLSDELITLIIGELMQLCSFERSHVHSPALCM